jgi:NAD(P)-dependent dehydrogenase (short-subunit alcohol dehydrogenase family)
MPQRFTVVTGGGRGLGAAISLRLAAEGRDVILSYLSDADSAHGVAQQIRDLNQRCEVLQMDCTDEGSVATFFAGVQEIGQMDGLVNNAGSAVAVGALEENDLSAISADLATNLFGPISCTKFAIPLLREAGGGAIVNISSAAAQLGGAGTYVHYSAAKAGVEALTVGLAKELAPHNIRVNTVSPGTLWTDFHQDPERPEKVAAIIPMGRAGQPEEIAGAVAWLLSDDAAYATGSVIKVSGGL